MSYVEVRLHSRITCRCDAGAIPDVWSHISPATRALLVSIRGKCGCDIGQQALQDSGEGDDGLLQLANASEREIALSFLC